MAMKRARPDHCAAFDAGQPYVTVSASSAFAHAGPGGDPSDAFIGLCRRLAAEIAQVVLVAPCEVDAAIMRKVQAATGLPLLGLNLPVAQGIDVLGNARAHVGGRWHPGIFAATGGTPLVAIGANTHKMAALMQQLHPGEPVFDARGLAGQVEEELHAREVTRRLSRSAAKARQALMSSSVNSGKSDIICA
mgnify:CR=1 FL=1